LQHILSLFNHSLFSAVSSSNISMLDHQAAHGNMQRCKPGAVSRTIRTLPRQHLVQVKLPSKPANVFIANLGGVISGVEKST
jgi:hypothetical protein